MTSNPTSEDDRPRPPLQELADAIAECLEFCHGHSGYNLPDLLSAALRQVAFERGGSWALTVHRPGCWEATHVEALAAGADNALHLDHDNQPREREY